MAVMKSRHVAAAHSGDRSLYGSPGKAQQRKLSPAQERAYVVLREKGTVTFVSHRGFVRSADTPLQISTFRALVAARLATSDWVRYDVCVFKSKGPRPPAAED